MKHGQILDGNMGTKRDFERNTEQIPTGRRDSHLCTNITSRLAQM